MNRIEQTAQYMREARANAQRLGLDPWYAPDAWAIERIRIEHEHGDPAMLAEIVGQVLAALDLVHEDGGHPVPPAVA